MKTILLNSLAALSLLSLGNGCASEELPSDEEQADMAVKFEVSESTASKIDADISFELEGTPDSLKNRASNMMRMHASVAVNNGVKGTDDGTSLRFGPRFGVDHTSYEKMRRGDTMVTVTFPEPLMRLRNRISLEIGYLAPFEIEIPPMTLGGTARVPVKFDGTRGFVIVKTKKSGESMKSYSNCSAGQKPVAEYLISYNYHWFGPDPRNFLASDRFQATATIDGARFVRHKFPEDSRLDNMGIRLCSSNATPRIKFTAMENDLVFDDPYSMSSSDPLRDGVSLRAGQGARLELLHKGTETNDRMSTVVYRLPSSK